MRCRVVKWNTGLNIIFDKYIYVDPTSNFIDQLQNILTTVFNRTLEEATLHNLKTHINNLLLATEANGQLLTGAVCKNLNIPGWYRLDKIFNENIV